MPKPPLVGRPGEHGSYYVLDPPPEPPGSAGSAERTLWHTRDDPGEQNPQHEGNLAGSAGPATGGSAEGGGRPGSGQSSEPDREAVERLRHTAELNMRAAGHDDEEGAQP